MKQPSYPCSCYICKKQTTSLGIDTHFLRAHGTDNEKSLWSNATKANKYKKVVNEQEYLLKPKYCKECNSTIPYDSRYNTFCSHTCSATASNRQRDESGWEHNKSSLDKIRDKLSIFSGPYTKIRFKPCKFCNTTFTSATRSQVCKNCQHLKWANNKDQYSFRFNIFDYPDLFDLSQIKIIGWVSFGGKRGGIKNPNGLSRDHKVSVNHAKKFKYDPYYISHPINCEIMPHSENNKKKTKSSLTYEELVYLVDEYNGLTNRDRTGDKKATSFCVTTTP